MNAKLFNSQKRFSTKICREFGRPINTADIADILYTIGETPGATAIAIELEHGGKISCRAIEWLMTAKGSQMVKLVRALDNEDNLSQKALRSKIEEMIA